jgi:hypothetical protein
LFARLFWVGGLGVSGAPLQPGYTHRLVVLPGGPGNLGRPDRNRDAKDLCKS